MRVSLQQVNNVIVKKFVVLIFAHHLTSEIKVTANFSCFTVLFSLLGPLDQFSHSMEPYLRSLGLPTSLERGKVTLLQDYTVCEMASILTPEQAKLMVSIHGNEDQPLSPSPPFPSPHQLL